MNRIYRMMQSVRHHHSSALFPTSPGASNRPHTSLPGSILFPILSILFILSIPFRNNRMIECPGEVQQVMLR